jgi:DNA-binding CsgD family transcriptional regulator
MDGEFWSIFERSANPMLLVDDDRRYVAANDAALALLGMARERLLASTLDELSPAEDVETFWRGFRERGSITDRWRLQTPNGELEVEYSATYGALPGRHLAIILAPAPPAIDVENGATARGRLSDRERQVVRAIAEGRTSPQIAQLLYLSPATIETHVRKAMGRLGARNRAHLIALALQAGEI